MPLPPLIEEIDYRDPMDALAALPIAAGARAPRQRHAASRSSGAGRGSRPTRSPASSASTGAPPGTARRSTAIRSRRCGRSSGSMPQPATGHAHPVSGRRQRLLLLRGRPALRAPARAARPNGADMPEIDLWFHDVGIAFDVVDRRAFLVSTGWPEDDPARRRAPRRGARRMAARHARSARRARPNAPIVIPRDAWRPNMSRPAIRRWSSGRAASSSTATFFRPTSRRPSAPSCPPDFDPLVLYAQLRAANPGALRGADRHAGAPHRLDLAGRLPAPRGRRGRDAPDQGHAPALRRSGRGPPPRRRAAREREGPRREHHDRRSDAQRSVARLPAAAAWRCRCSAGSKPMPRCIISSRWCAGA